MHFSGKAKAAVFLLSLEEAKAVKIIEQLNERELKELRDAVESLNPVTSDNLETVYDDFSAAFKKGLAPIHGGSRYLCDLVRQARGDEEAIRLFAAKDHPGQALLPEGPRPLAALAEVDPEVLKIAIAEEHPQIAAAILAYLEPGTAAQILEHLPSAHQIDVLKRVATLKYVPPSSFADAEQGLGGFELASSTKGGEVDGISSAATILNEMATSVATELIERIAEHHPEEAQRLQRAMFSFENLLDADTRGLQQLLREVQSDTLLIALKTASDPLKEKLLSCMSRRAASMLLEELEMMPPVRLSEVESAQQQIVDVAMRLVGEGKLSIKGYGEELL